MVRQTVGPPTLGRFLAGDMGVDLFFVISGFIMVAAHPLSCTKAAQVGDFIARRITRIYPLYWLYSLPALAIYLWKPGWLHRIDQGMQVHPMSSFLLWPQDGWPVLGQAWSLSFEMYFYAVFAGLMWSRAKWFGYSLLAWAGIVLTGHALAGVSPGLDHPETKLLFSLLTLEFIAGALVGLAVLRWRTVWPGWGWFLAACGLAWIMGVVLPLNEHLTGGKRVFVYGLPAVALVYGSIVLERNGVRAPRFLSVIGDWSYSIYLSHIFVIAALARVVSSVWTSRPWLEVSVTAICLGAVLACGAMSYYFLERPLLRVTRRWLSAWFFDPITDMIFSSRSPVPKRRLLVLTPTLGTSPYLDETVRSIERLEWPIEHVLVCPVGKIAELARRFPRAACRRGRRS